MEPRQYAVFKHALREALRLLEAELVDRRRGEQGAGGLVELVEIRRELASLNAQSVGALAASQRRPLRARGIVRGWPVGNEIREAVLEVDTLYVGRLP